MRSHLRVVAVVALLAAALVICAPGTAGAQQPTAAERFQRAVQLFEAHGDYATAIREFEALASDPDRALAARALFYIGLAWERLDTTKAWRAYGQLVARFPDQPDAVARARARLASLHLPATPGPPRALSDHRVGSAPFPAIGRPSGDGRLVPVLVDQGAAMGIYDVSTGQRTVLRADPAAMPGYPGPAAMSPDGRQVAVNWQGGVAPQELLVSPADHWSPHSLHRFDSDLSLLDFAWAPDASRFAAILRGRGFARLVLISAADGSFTPEKEFDGVGPSEIDWSPDGKRLAYSHATAADPGNEDVFVFDLATDEERAVVSHPARDFGARWTPDGSGLVFFSDRTGSVGVWLQAIDGLVARGEPRLIRRDIGRAEPLSLTRDGSLFYQRQEGLVDVYTAPFDQENARVAGAVAVEQPRNSGSNNTSAWSPDGRQLAVVRSLAWSAPESSSIVIRDTDGGVVRELAPHLHGFLTLNWSPDGRELLTKGYSTAMEYGFFRIDAVSGAVTPILTVPPNDETEYGHGIWTPDGQGIVYRGPRGLMRRDIATGREEVWLTAGEGESFGGSWFRFSADGRSFVYVTQHAEGKASIQCVRIREADGRTREVYRAAFPFLQAFHAWTPDGRWLLFVRSPPGAEHPWIGELWAVPAAGGDARPTGLAMPALRAISVSPDGRRLAFTAGDPSWELWAIDNLLPAGAGDQSTRAAARKASARAQKQH